MTPLLGTRQDVSLGVLAPDIARSILVISRNGELAVALNDHVDRAYALVRDVRPTEVGAGLEACRPWPWMVISDVADASDAVVKIAQNRPILLFWMTGIPAGLPAHARRFHSFPGLVDAVHESLQCTVAGIRLSAGDGVVLPDGAHAQSPELQALVASHPRELNLPLGSFRSARRLLVARRIPYRPARGGGRRTVRLEKVSLGRHL